MNDLVLYIVLVSIAAALVMFINFKKSRDTNRRIRHTRFRDSYMQKKKEKYKEKENEDLHKNR